MGHIEMALKLKEETGEPQMVCLKAAQQYPYDYEKAKEYVLNRQNSYHMLVDRRQQPI